MCGICGIYRSDLDPVNVSRVRAMMAEMTARGPDASGTTHGTGYAFGHLRLSIQDLSDAASQPMTNEDGSVEIIFNGEIYNFQELREALKVDHAFRTRSDTEVLIHGYEEWGLAGLLDRIRGMYAFAILDHSSHTLHLARDPVGKKPIAFRYDGKELVFASTVKALLAGLTSTPEVDPKAIDSLLSGLYVAGPGTILRGVEKLPAGTALTLGRDGVIHTFRHWQPDFSEHECDVSDEDWLERIEQKLEAAVRRRLIADVPIGILLSGGIDSGLVTAIASKVAGPVRTFAVAADDARYDESKYAAAVATKCGTDHHTLRVRSDIRKNLPDLIAAMGEPLADASIAQVFEIAKMARDHVTVVLTGDGGDELFGGYQHYLAYHCSDFIRCAAPPFAAPALAQFGGRLQSAGGALRRAGTILRYAALSPTETLPSRNLPGDLRARLYTGSLQRSLNGDGPHRHYAAALARNGGAARVVDQVMGAQFETLLVDDYLVKIDNGTMAASLEARSPFLDIDLAETAMRIPAGVRFRGFRPKSLLRKLALKYLPEHCVNRPKKGFVTPVGKWLRNGWSDLADRLLLDSPARERGWFEPQAVRQVLQEHRGGTDRGYLIWSMMVLELWVRSNLDRVAIAEQVL